MGAQFSRAILCTCNQLADEPQCKEASFWLFAGFATMLMGMVLQTLTVKYTSAAIAVIATTIVTPLSTLAFTSPVLMGPFAEKFPPTTFASLAIIVVGMLLYRSADVADDVPV